MDDLIRRQAAIDALNKMKIYRPLDSDRYVISDCLNKIVNLPSAQKKGHWSLQHGRMRTDYIHSGYMPHKNYCSCCEKDSPYDKRWKFCPNCGADMRGENDG